LCVPLKFLWLDSVKIIYIYSTVGSSRQAGSALERSVGTRHKAAGVLLITTKAKKGLSNED
jgi:hypothetical protein